MQKGVAMRDNDGRRAGQRLDPIIKDLIEAMARDRVRAELAKERERKLRSIQRRKRLLTPPENKEAE